MNASQKKKGFTLIELVIYIAIFTIAVMVLFQFLIGVLAARTRSTAREAVINNAVYAIDMIDFEIRHADTIYDATSDFASTSTQLSLASERDMPSGEVQVFVDIFLEDGKICMKKETSGVQCLNSDEVVATGLSFQKILLDDGSESGIRTTVNMEYNTQVDKDKNSFELSSFTKLRNYQ